MSEIFTIKNSQKEMRLFSRRLLIISVAAILLILCLIARLVYLQIFQHNYYVTQSISNRIDLIPIPPRRGLVLDRNGIILAKNIPVYSLMVTPSETKHLKTSIQLVSNIITLSPTDLEQFYKQLKAHRRFEQIPLKIKLTKTEVAKFEVQRYRFPGFSVQAKLMRYYPLNGALAHVVGYVGRINMQDLTEIDTSNYAGTNFIGKVGIEKFYETLLHGLVGYQKVEIDAAGNIIRTLSRIPPQKGDNLYLTIDSQLQMAAEKAVGDNRAAVVAVDPNNGQILALVSQPSYDPNIFVKGVSEKAYAALQGNSNYPLYNRTIRGLYSPGSVIKPFVALALLDSDLVKPSYQIVDPGWYRLPHTKHTYYDWKPGGHGRVNVTKAIIQSCDTYFYKLSPKLGINRMDNVLWQFGFGQKTGLDMLGEMGGNIPSPAWKMRYRGTPWYTGDTIITAIGQGFMQVTPLQLVMATAALSMHGERFASTLLYAIRSPNGQLDKRHAKAEEPVILNHPEYWNVVIDAMRRVVSEGTGFRFGHTPYTVAAKTGTAQLVSIRHSSKNVFIPERLRDNSVFIAFAPVRHPKIVVAVVVENSTVSAVAVARKVIDSYLLSSVATPQQKGAGTHAATRSIVPQQVLVKSNSNEPSAMPKQAAAESSPHPRSVIPRHGSAGSSPHGSESHTSATTTPLQTSLPERHRTMRQNT